MKDHRRVQGLFVATEDVQRQLLQLSLRSFSSVMVPACLCGSSWQWPRSPLFLHLLSLHVWRNKDHHVSWGYGMHLNCGPLSLSLSSTVFYTYLTRLVQLNLIIVQRKDETTCESFRVCVVMKLQMKHRRDAAEVCQRLPNSFPSPPPHIFDTSLRFPASSNSHSFEVQERLSHTHISSLSPHGPSSGKEAFLGFLSMWVQFNGGSRLWRLVRLRPGVSFLSFPSWRFNRLNPQMLYFCWPIHSCF